MQSLLRQRLIDEGILIPTMGPLADRDSDWVLSLPYFSIGEVRVDVSEHYHEQRRAQSNDANAADEYHTYRDWSGGRAAARHAKEAA